MTRRSETPFYLPLASWITASLLALIASRGVAFSPSRFARRPSVRMISTSSFVIHNNNDDVSSSTDLWKTLLDRFQGDFDNYQQVLQDRQDGLYPKEGGGHEHIHCTLIPVTEQTRLAAFYFDGMPQAIFRFRYYHLQPVTEQNCVVAVDTTLYTLHPQLEAQLRSLSLEPMLWPDIFRNFTDNRINLLPNCEVRWTWEMDPVQHAYAASYHSTDEAAGIHAVMVHGQAIVDSQMAPGTKILIQDQLSLWADEFWIHDRGYDPNDTTKFIYGNQRGIPYRLDRVTRIEHGDRRVTSHDLRWTLGPSFRTEAMYQEKLEAVGGPSAKR